MKKILVLGAGGQIARWVIDMLANNSNIEMNLFLRHPSKIKRNPPKNAHVVQGNVLDMEQLKHAIDGQDIVYANLTGEDVDIQAANIVKAMNVAGVKRLIFVASLALTILIGETVGYTTRFRANSAHGTAVKSALTFRHSGVLLMSSKHPN